MEYFDAHSHLQDERLKPVLPMLWEAYRKMGLSRVVVNGIQEADWAAVQSLSEESPLVKPSYGVHPWFVDTLSDGWREQLAALWQNEDAAVGEIGFDRWKTPFDIDLQWEVFSWQFEQATRMNRPVSIHCLKAWGILNECLKERKRPERGFLLHSFGGSMETARGFLKMGAYFSFSAYFSIERKGAVREVFRELPLDRILIETDAPDMKGAAHLSPYELEGEEGGNHPLNIAAVYDYVADLREMDPGEFRSAVADNYRRFFGN